MAYTTITLSKDQSLEVKDVQNKVPPFIMLGKKLMLTDIEDIFANLSSKATWLLWTLQKTKNKVTNISKLDPMSKTEINSVSIGYKELHKLNIIKRIAPKTYLINPDVLLPYPNRYESVKQHWDSI